MAKLDFYQSAMELINAETKKLDDFCDALDNNRFEKKAKKLLKLNKEGKLSDAELDKAHARFKGIYRHVLENVIEADLEESESETPA